MATKQVLSTFGVGRRRPDDPFFEEGDGVCHADRRLGVYDIDEEQLCHKVVECFDCSVPGCVETFDSLFYFDLHYNSVHRYFCAECKKRLPSPHLLDLHLSEHHDSFFLVQAERKPMYRCYVEQCEVISANAPERRHHCIADHKFPHDFRFDKPPKHNTGKKKKQPGIATEKMETNLDPSKEVEAKEKPKKRKPRPKKKSGATAVLMDVCGGSEGLPVEEEMPEECPTDTKSKNVPPTFIPFSFGRGGRGRRGAASGRNWFQRPSSTAPMPSSSLETTMVDDLRSALPAPMT